MLLGVFLLPRLVVSDEKSGPSVRKKPT